MKRMLAAAVLSTSIALAAPALAQDSDDFGRNNEFTTEQYEYDDDFGFDDEGVLNDEDDYGFGDDEYTVGADGLASDDYGYYDNRYGWDTEDSRWDSWYGNADDDWADAYDDVGDEGLFDV